jgi:hypothetical protein
MTGGEGYEKTQISLKLASAALRLRGVGADAKMFYTIKRVLLRKSVKR